MLRRLRNQDGLAAVQVVVSGSGSLTAALARPTWVPGPGRQAAMHTPSWRHGGVPSTGQRYRAGRRGPPRLAALAALAALAGCGTVPAACRGSSRAQEHTHETQ